MAYKPRGFHNVRDETYVSQIASERPICAPRIHCSEEPSVFPDAADATLRGRDDRAPEVPHEHFEGICARFNRALRSGLGTGRPDNTDE